MASIATQYKLTGTERTTQILVPAATTTIVVDIHIFNYDIVPVLIDLWVSSSTDTTLDESGMIEYKTELSTGDHLVYSGKTIGVGKNLIMSCQPLNSIAEFKVAVQVAGFKE